MEKVNAKGQWGSKFGFLMASVGSAVGLGNLWGFPYKMGANGGFAFLLIYLVLFAVVGIVMMLTELSLGRSTGKGIIQSYSELGKKYTFIGWLGWLSPFLILGFYIMLGGYTIKYFIANLGDLFHASWGVAGADSGEFFGNFTSNMGQASLFSLIFLGLTMLVVARGVQRGIEKVSSIAMPALFVMLVIVIIRACTLPGATAGLEFVFKPNFEVFQGTGWINVLAAAGGQLFFSLSLAMGIMVTYGSYLRKEDNLQQNAVIIPFADTLVAVMAAMATMPAVFAAGLEPGAGPGLLFVTLQIVFDSLGAIGPLFGFLFYFLTFIAAFTSSISLVETVVAALMDRNIAKGKPVARGKSTTIIGIALAVETVFISIDGLGANGFAPWQVFGLSEGDILNWNDCWLDFFDLLSEGIMMPLGSLLTAIIFGWIKTDWIQKEVESNGSSFTMKGFWTFCIKFIVPVMMALILLGQIDNFFGLGLFS